MNSFKSASAAPISRRIAAGLAALAFAGLAPLVQAPAQSLQVPNPAVPTAQSFQGSVPTGEATAQPIDLSLDDAIQRGLRNNLGVILSGTLTAVGPRRTPH